MVGTVIKQGSSDTPRLFRVANLHNQDLELIYPKHFMLSDEKEDLLTYCEFTIHHRLRAEWARVSGLVELLNTSYSEQEQVVIKALLKKSLNEMDNAMREVSQKLFTRGSQP